MKRGELYRVSHPPTRDPKKYRVFVIHCDELVSLPKSLLTTYIGALAPVKMEMLTRALRVALEIPD